MLRKSSFFVSVLILCFSFNSYAIEKFTCAELEATANDMEDIADGFHAAGLIREGDPIDLALRDVIDSLYVYAAVEKEIDLSYFIDRLESAWQRMDGDNFADALEGVIDSFDRLIRRDCY